MGAAQPEQLKRQQKDGTMQDSRDHSAEMNEEDRLLSKQEQEEELASQNFALGVRRMQALESGPVLRV